MSRNCTKNSMIALSTLVELNVYMFRDNQLVFSWEASTSSVYSLLNQPMESILSAVQVSRPMEYEMVENIYRERYIVFVLPNQALLILGPFVLETNESLEIQKILRKMEVTVQQSREILHHHRTLPVYSRRFCQSLLALLEQMYAVKKTPPAQETFVSGKGTVISRYYQKTVAEVRMKYRVRSPIALERRLMLHIERGDWNKAKDTLDDINSLDSAVFTTDPVQSKRYSLVAGCTLYTRAIIRAGINYMTAFSLSDAMIRTIHTTETLEELNAFEYEMLELFCETVAKQTKGKYSLPVIKAMEYIGVHLPSPISLEDIGKHVQLHPNYISNLFRKEVKVPISKYIQQMRIEESKHLLLGTNENIASISNFYQFCNEAYYIRVFREYENMTPTEYRRKNANIRGEM